MNQISFVETRFRRNDPPTSKRAAVRSVGRSAAELRLAIQSELRQCGNGLTAKQLAYYLDADYYDVQRRLSETANIRKTSSEYMGCMIWEYHKC